MCGSDAMREMHMGAAHAAEEAYEGLSAGLLRALAAERAPGNPAGAAAAPAAAAAAAQ